MYGKNTTESVNPITAGVGQAIALAGGVGTEIWRGLGDIATSVFGSPEQLRKRLQEQKSSPNKYYPQLKEIGDRSERWKQELFSVDENIGAWSRGDVLVQGMNASEFFNERSKDRDIRYSNKEGEYARNARTSQKVNFVKEEKTNLPYINDLKAVVESQIGKKVSSDSTFGYSFNPVNGMYDIDVLVQEKVQKKGKDTFTTSYSQETISVKPEDMTERLRQRISPSTVNYANSYYNPNRQTEKVSFRIPTTSSNKEALLKNIMTKGGNNSIELESQLSQLIKTPAERLSELAPYIKKETQKADLNKLYNTSFEVRYLGSSEQGYIPEVVGKLGNMEVYTRKFGLENSSAIENPQAVLITTAHYTNLALKELETEIITNGEK